MRPSLYELRKNILETCASDSKLVVSEMAQQKYDRHILAAKCVHQTDLSSCIWRLRILVAETKKVFVIVSEWKNGVL